MGPAEIITISISKNFGIGFNIYFGSNFTTLNVWLPLITLRIDFREKHPRANWICFENEFKNNQ